MKILFEDHQTDLSVDPESIQTLIKELLLFKGVQTDEISLRFVSEEEICNLHEQFFNDPSPTDCITFPIDRLSDVAKPHCIGEIIICPKTAQKQSLQYQTDVYEELTLYIIHGILHLLGFDDQTEEDRAIMKKEEANCLSWARTNKLIAKIGLY